MSEKKQVFLAGRWITASALLRSGLQILQLMILARLLTPSDFGLMAVVGSILAVVMLFTDMGVSRAIVHFDHLTDKNLSSLYWLNLIIGLLLTLLFASLAPILGILFRLDGLVSILFCMSPSFILIALGQQYCALAEKKLNFKVLSINEIIAAICGFIISISIAVNNGGVYALVAGLLVTIATNSLLACFRLAKDYPLHWHLNLKETIPFLNYGGYIVGESLISTVQRQSDIFIASFFSNSSTLGLYSMPRDFCLRIGMTVNPIITRIGFPLMSRHKNDFIALKQIYLQTMRMTASLNFPLYIMLTIFAEEVVLLIFGEQWVNASIYMQLLAIWGVLRSIGNPVGSLLHAVGSVRRAFWWNVSMLLILPLCYWVSAKANGLIGLSYTLVLSAIFLLPLMWWLLVKPLCNVHFKEYLTQVMVPSVLSLISGLVTWLLVYEITHILFRLLVGGLTFGVFYLLLSRYFNRVWFEAILLLLKGIFKKDSRWKIKP